MSLGLYIHVPFCIRKCSYCDFYSVCYSDEQAELYVQAVLRNIRHYSDRSVPTETVYFGGGTPSLLSPDQLGRMLSEIRSCFSLDKNAEITLEANPCTLSPEKLSYLRDVGINRLSIGVQSLQDSELQELGRLHSEKTAVQAVQDAANAGFDNISCDLMLALPGQSRSLLEQNIRRMTALPIQHISAYILKIEPDTPFGRQGVEKRLPSAEETAELYLFTVSELERCGFMQYEVSNFARPGFESRHNSRYWKCLDYIGIGPGAHSCFGGKRFAVERDLERFISSPVQEITVTDEDPCGFEEYAMLRLRLTEGLSLDDFPERRAELEKKLPPLIESGYVRTDGQRVWLTPEGFLVSNSVIEYLVF